MLMKPSLATLYDNLVLQNPKALLAVLISVLIFFGYHAKNFGLDASADSLLLEDDKDLKFLEKYVRGIRAENCLL